MLNQLYYVRVSFFGCFINDNDNLGNIKINFKIDVHYNLEILSL